MVLSISTRAQVFKDDFTGLTVGATLAGQSGWTKGGSGPDVSVANASPLTYAGYSGGGAEYVVMPTPTASTSKVYKSFPTPVTSFTGTTFYCSLLLRITATSATGSNYFMSLGVSGVSTSYGVKLFTVTNGSGFNIGLSKTSTTAVFGTTVLSLNTTYLVVVRYTFNSAGTVAPQKSDDVAYLWINPALSSTPDTSTAECKVWAGTDTDFDGFGALTDIGSFIWHNRGTGNPTGAFDGIKVGNGASNSIAWANLVTAPLATISPVSLNFDKVNVGTSVTDTISVKNSGFDTLKITSASSSNPVFAISPGSASILPSATQKFAVTFTPTNPVTSSAKISFVSNAATSPDSVLVSGSGTQKGFSMTPTSLNFGNVFKDSTKIDSVTVSNAGTTAHLVIDSVRSSNPLFTVTPTNADLDTSSSKTFVVHFTPTAKGAVSGNIVFYHDTLSKQDTLKVSGNGILKEPLIKVTPTSLDLGIVLLGQSKKDSVVVQNIGYDSLFITGIASSDTEYTFTPATARLDTMATQKFYITFRPTAVGRKTTVIVATSNVFEVHDTLHVTGVGSIVATIAEARKDANNDFIPDHSVTQDTLVVYGVITTQNLSASVGQTTYLIQDSTAGIDVFSFSLTSINFALGDSVIVVGTVTQYRGLTEFTPLGLDSAHFGIVKHGAAVPKPKRLTLHQYVLNAESYEGQLIVIDSLYKVAGTWPAFGTNGLLYVTNASRVDTTQLFFDLDTDIDGTPEPQYPINVVGIASQYSSAATVYNNGYQIIPRNITDISKTKVATTVKISEARKDANNDLIPDHSITKDTLAVYGVITSPNFQPSQTSYFIQDSTAGINVFSFTPYSTTFAIGDSVVVVGTVAQFRGLTEFTPLVMDSSHFGLLKHKAVVPKPKRLTLHQFVLNTENYEGSLIEIDTLYKASGTWPAAGSNASIFMTNASKVDTTQMFIDLDTDIDGTPELAYPINVVGVASQFSSATTVFNNGYEIVPRDTFDIHHQTVVIVKDLYSGIPNTYELHNNYPNPFNPSTTILYGLPRQSHVTVTIYSVLGQELATLVNDVQGPSYYRVVWNGQDKNGGQVSSGVYFFRIVAEPTDDKAQPFVHAKRMLLMK
jgi:DNA/RNA endonuclease YhcR with UshA esterase domain